MAKLAMISNRISDVQEKNLKLYPFVFFDGLKKAEIHYDLSVNHDVDATEKPAELDIAYKLQKPETKHLKIVYKLSVKRGIKLTHKEKRFAALKQAVRDLLWSGILVQIYINNKLVYKGV
jgi:hypothetical protein